MWLIPKLSINVLIQRKYPMNYKCFFFFHKPRVLREFPERELFVLFRLTFYVFSLLIYISNDLMFTEVGRNLCTLYSLILIPEFITISLFVTYYLINVNDPFSFLSFYFNKKIIQIERYEITDYWGYKDVPGLRRR